MVWFRSQYDGRNASAEVADARTVRTESDATGLALMSEARITSGTEWMVGKLIDDTSASPGFSVMGGYERRVASNHQDSSVPSFNRESNPLLPLLVGRFFTEPFR